MNVMVLEQDEKLIEKGRKKLNKLNSKVCFHEHRVGVDHLDLSLIQVEKNQMAIGLHTCGHFANDMLRDCVKTKVQKIINFGCCYSKIKDQDYNISKAADRSLIFNQRALSSATLGFGPIPTEFFHYRKKIMNYKFSFYHWLFKETGYLEFCSMSNARRSLYQMPFDQFVYKNLEKFFPKITHPGSHKLIEFFESDENRKLNKYLESYYALSRFFGPLLESYLLCDRALYLQDNGYKVDILEVFDHQISPRNKAIIAYH